MTTAPNIIDKYAIEGGTCELRKYGTVVLRAWPHPDGAPGDIRLSRTDLAELLRLSCGDIGTLLTVIGTVMTNGHRFTGYDPEPFPGVHPDREYTANRFDYDEEPF